MPVCRQSRRVRQASSALRTDAQLEEERNEGRGHEAASGSGGQNGDCNKLIRCPARVSRDDSTNARDEGRHRHDSRAKSPAKLSDLPLVWFEANQERSETKEANADQSRAEPLADAPALFGVENDACLGFCLVYCLRNQGEV
jgi:hypothetical protein